MFDFVFAGENVLGKAILGGVVAGEPHGKVFTHGQVNGPFERGAVPLTKVDVEMAVSAANLCFVGVYAKGTTDRVAAEQEALRSAQNFSALYIVKTGDNGAVTSLVKIVFKEGRGRIPAYAKVLGPNAPHTHGIDIGIL